MRMPIQCIHSFTVLIFITLQSNAQIESVLRATPQAYSQQLDELEIVKNDAGLLPIRSIDSMQFMLRLTDSSDFPEFVSTLKYYGPSILSDDSEKGGVNAIIVAIRAEDMPYDLGPQFNVPIILVIFGSLEIDISYSSFRSVIHAPDHPIGHSLAAQAIFGGLPIDENIPMRLGFAPPGSQGLDQDSLHNRIYAILQEGIDSSAYPGAQVLVARNGKVVYHRCIGHHTYDRIKAVQPTDMYDFASVTKTTSALLALMKLNGEGLFELDAKLPQYFPLFQKSNKKHLTFRQMLAHNARLRPWIPYWQGTIKGNAKYPWKKSWDTETTNNYRFRKNTFAIDSSAEYSIFLADSLWMHNAFKERFIYHSIKKSPLNKEPGYVYSGLLFYLLPEIVSDLTKTNYEAYLEKQFYGPLGAKTIGYKPLKRFALKNIVPTERDTFFRHEQLHGVVHDEGAAMMQGVSGNAGLFGSAGDLAKLAQMLLNEGRYGGQTFIKPSSVRAFTGCQYCEQGNRRGLGFDKPLIEYDEAASSVAKDASPNSFGHSGYTGTFYWVDPDEQLIYIFFSNRVYPTRNNRKLYSLGIRPRIHQAIYDCILED